GLRRQGTVVRVPGLRIRNRRLHRHAALAPAGHLRAWHAQVSATTKRRVRLHPAERPLVLPPNLNNVVRCDQPASSRLITPTVDKALRPLVRKVDVSSSRSGSFLVKARLYR